MKINKASFCIFILYLFFIATNYAKDSNIELIKTNKNIKIDISSDDSEEEIYNSSSKIPFIQSTNKSSSNLNKIAYKKKIKKILCSLLILGGFTIIVVLYFKLIDSCYFDKDIC